MVLSDAAKVVLVTGASSGIGAATALRLAHAGYRVYGTSRRGGPGQGGITMLSMDVCDPGSVAAAVNAVMDACGRIDALVNNAGFGLAGSVEDTGIEDLHRQLDANLFGALRVCQAVLPIMRAQGSGRIVQISSLAARIGVPFQGAYSASKAALARLSEALAIEVAPFNIEVVLIEPGDTRTNFTAARSWTGAALASGVYRERAHHAIAVMEKSEAAGRSADDVARLVEQALSAPKPRLCYVSATPLEHVLLFLHRVLPGRAFEAIMKSTYEKPRAK